MKMIWQWYMSARARGFVAENYITDGEKPKRYWANLGDGPSVPTQMFEFGK